MKSKIRLISFAFAAIVQLLFINNNCSAKTNVIILVDSRIFVNTDNVAKFDELKSKMSSSFLEKIWDFYSPDNTYTLYTFSPENDKFLAQEIILGKHWHDLNRYLNVSRYTAYVNLSNAKLYANAFELLKHVDDRTSSLTPKDYSDQTVLIVFSKSTFSYCYGSKVPTMLSFKEIINNDALKFDYKNNPPPNVGQANLNVDTGKTNTMIIQVSQYLVKKSVANIFGSSGQDERKLFLFDCDRKTVPGNKSLKLFVKQSDNNIKINLLADDKVEIESAVLAYIKGKDSGANLLPDGRSVVFSSNLNALPPGLSGSISNATPFPLFDMMQPYLALYSTTPVDTAYLGQMIVKYRLIDGVYSHILYSDTLNFKINVDKPEYLYMRANKKILLDNAALIKYGNQLSPNKPLTQDELTSGHKKKIRVVMYFTIALLVMIIILFWFFIRKNKKLTWANIRTFWK